MNSIEIAHFIAGREVAGTSGRRQAVYNPATGQVSAQVALASAGEVDAAVAAAQVPDLAAEARLLKAEILGKDLADREQSLAEYENLIVEHPETLAADRAREERAKLTRAVP